MKIHCPIVFVRVRGHQYQRTTGSRLLIRLASIQLKKYPHKNRQTRPFCLSCAGSFPFGWSIPIPEKGKQEEEFMDEDFVYAESVV